jgi:hypothetical protein
LPLVALLDRLDPEADGDIPGTDEVIDEIRALEEAATQPTEAHEPVEATPAQAAIIPADRSEAPTIVASVVPASLAGSASELSERLDTGGVTQFSGLKARSSKSWRVLAVGGTLLLLLITCAALLWPRTLTAGTQKSGTASGIVGEISAPTPSATHMPLPALVSLQPTPAPTATVQPPQPPAADTSETPTLGEPLPVSDPPANNKRGNKGKDKQKEKDDD